jgi:hypothetical protein
MRIHGLAGVVFNLFDGFMQDLEHASQSFDLEHRRLDQGRISCQGLSFLQGMETLLDSFGAAAIMSVKEFTESGRAGLFRAGQVGSFEQELGGQESGEIIEEHFHQRIIGF